VDILRSTKEESEKKSGECADKKAELEKAAALAPYYEYWSKGFSPEGIPRLAVSRIISRLNSRVAYWLQFLINGKIKVTFDDELDETIERVPADGDPYTYPQLSGGERRRINLAISQAFAYVMMASCNAAPSVVFLDEVTSNIDQSGVIGVHNMIMELAKTKQVFITTHDQGLIDLLAGCETIRLEKKNGFTKIVNN
jgi:ABC-type lipoprotein export system ATPase subunit